MLAQEKTNKAAATAAPNHNGKQHQNHNSNNANSKKPLTKHTSNSHTSNTTKNYTAPNNNKPSGSHTSTHHKNKNTPPLDTPSHIAKSKLQDLYETLPSEPLAVAARTYASRLHQLRLQRDHRRATHERLTSQQNLPLQEQTLPSSCNNFRFELGASHAVKLLDEYGALQQRSQNIVEQCQKDLAACIAELQLLEVQSKQEEIRRTFCEGLYKIALSLINHYRETSANNTIQTSMQSQRLSDRLVELLLEKYPSVLELSELADPQAALVAYYKYMDRPPPNPQNRDHPSSPYNTIHTTFLTGMLDEFHGIVERCFHTLWIDYQTALALRKQQQEQDKLQQENNKARIPDSAEKLKELVQSAVSEETEALKITIRNLELQLQQQQQQQKEDVKKEDKTKEAEHQQAKMESAPVAGNKKGNQRNRKGKGKAKQEQAVSNGSGNVKENKAAAEATNGDDDKAAKKEHTIPAPKDEGTAKEKAKEAKKE